jgi:hypothetical protein
MITTLVLISLLGAGAAWMYYQGKTSAQAEGLESDMKKSKKINEMNKEHDQDTDAIFRAMDAPSLLRRKPNRNR